MVQPTIAQVLAVVIGVWMIAFAYQQRKKWGWGKRIGYPLLVEAVWLLIAFVWESRFGSAMHQAEAGVTVERGAGSIQGFGDSLGSAAKVLDLDQLAVNVSSGLSSGDFSWLIGYWPLVATAVLVILLVGLARWVWGRTQIPTAAATTGTTTSGTTSGAGVSLLRLVNLGVGAAALAVSALVVVLVLRWSGWSIGAPSFRPLLPSQFPSAAVRLADENPAEIISAADFLPALPEILDGNITPTLTIASAHTMLVQVQLGLNDWNIKDRNPKIVISQDARDSVADWTEDLGLLLTESGINPTKGFEDVYLFAHRQLGRSRVLSGPRIRNFPPEKGEEYFMMLELVPAVAELKVWTLDINSRNKSSDVLAEELEEARKRAVLLVSVCESHRNMFAIGQAEGKSYEPAYVDAIENDLCVGVYHYAGMLGIQTR